MKKIILFAIAILGMLISGYYGRSDWKYVCLTFLLGSIFGYLICGNENMNIKMIVLRVLTVMPSYYGLIAIGYYAGIGADLPITSNCALFICSAYVLWCAAFYRRTKENKNEK